MARTTSNLNLKVWDDLNDQFSHGDLEDNWDAIDSHNHSTNPIGASGLGANAVTTAKVADSAITRPKIADFAINNSKLDTSSVTTTKLSDKAVSSRTFGPTSGVAVLDSDLALTASAQIAATVTINVEIPSYIVVNAVWYGFVQAGGSGNSVRVQGRIEQTQNGTPVAPDTGDTVEFTSVEDEFTSNTVNQTYYLSAAPGTHILDQVGLYSLTGSISTLAPTLKVGTRFTYLVVAA